MLALLVSLAPALTAPPHVHSLPLSIYIEDTDCFDVCFYANYLKFWERAAVAMLGAPNIGKLLHDDERQLSRFGLSFGLQSAHGLKYSTPARLGDECEAKLVPLGIDADGRLAASAELVRMSDDTVLCSAADLRFGFVSRATAQRTCWPEERSARLLGFPVADADAPAPADPCDLTATPPPADTSPTLDPPGLALQLDEASASGSLSLYTVTRYFERHRTTFLGGPAGLQDLSEAGVDVVVGRINNLRLFDAAHAVRVGEPLELRCKAALKAKNTQIVFEQWLTTPDGEPLARADVTALCLDPAAGKMCAAPDEAIARVKKWLLDEPA